MTGTLNLPDPRDLDLEDVPAAIAQLAGLQTALSARLITERQQPVQEEDDIMLTAREAAAVMNISIDWLYKNAKNLPFARRIGGRRGLRYSKRGLVTWLAKRRG